MAPVCTLRSLLIGAAVFTSVSSAALSAQGYVVKRTTHGDLVHWDERTVGFTLDHSVESNVKEANSATLESMSSWSGNQGAPELHALEPTSSSPTEPGFDNKNGVFFKPYGWEAAGRALAITVLTYDNASGKILDADLIVNGNYHFAVLSPNVGSDRGGTLTTDLIDHEDEEETDRDPATVYDLHHVIAHELGHALGMNDEMGRRDALMYRYSAPNDASMREPASDDIKGLAELYGEKLEGSGSGCGSTVSPKKPTKTASYGATLATLGLLVFLALRAKRDRRARLGFMIAATGAAIALMPDLSGGKGIARAQSSELGAKVGHARAKVTNITTSIEHGVFKTAYNLSTVECNTTACPKISQGVAWGGTIGNIRQDVGTGYAPVANDDVDVSFKSLPKPLAKLTSPLPQKLAADTSVRVVTKRR